MDYVDFVEKNKSKYKNYTWLKQFDRNTDGVRMTPQKFLGMKIKYGMEDIPDGILGERMMRQLLKTDILKDKLDPAVFGRKLTDDECNDIINYYAWATFDCLALRATEGRNEIIPRQEYEFLAFMSIFLRSGEFTKLAVLKLGWEKIVRRMFATRKELGGTADQIAMGAWATVAEPFFGDISLQHLGMIQPDDPAIVDKKKTFIDTGLIRSYTQTGGDGMLSGARRRYVYDKEPEVVEFCLNNVQAVDAKKMTLFKKFYAACQLLAFISHFDNRGGIGDAGPFVVEDGKPMLTRTTVVNEPVYPWSTVQDRQGLPFSFNFICVFDPDKINLQEMRVNDIATSMSAPPNFMDALEKVAVFRRDEPEGPEPLPLSKLHKVDFSEMPDWIEKINNAITDWYIEVGRLTKRQKIYNGYYVYSWVASTLGGFLRPLGLWDYVNENCDFFEQHPMVSEAYYHLGGKVITEVVPIQIYTGAGWTDFTSKAAPTSKYREYLRAARRDGGWVSDLTGMSPIPDDLKAHVDGDGILQVPLEIKWDPNWLK